MTRTKQSVELKGRRTSISLEVEYWEALSRLADEENVSTQVLIEQIRDGYFPTNLTSALRLFVLKRYQQKLGERNEKHSDKFGPRASHPRS